MRVYIWLILGVVFPVFLAWQGCRGEQADEVGGTLSVFVSIAPQAWLANQLGQDHVSVNLLVPSGQSPATYEPGPKQVARLSEADLFIPIGVGFEKSLRRKLDRMSVSFDTVELPKTIEHHFVEDDCGHDSDSHNHQIPDPHIWLDPLMMKILARSMTDAFIVKQPQQREFFEKRLAVVEEELDRLHRTLAETLAPHKGRQFLVYHGAYGYFARRYGLDQKAISYGARNPGARRVAEVLDSARDAGVGAVVVQSEFSEREAQAVARELGVEVVELDPLSPDYPGNLEAMATTLARLFDERGGQHD